MGEEPISERLKWIRTRYFEQQQQMAEAMGCASSYLTKLLKPGAHEVGPSLLVNLVKKVHEIAADRSEDASWITPGWVQFGGPKGVGTGYPARAMAPLSTHDVPGRELTPEEFRDAADRLAVECHRRGHRVAARALMDLVDVLDGLSGAGASAAKSAKVSQAIEDLASVRPGKPTA